MESKESNEPNRPHFVDAHVGQKIRTRRIEMNLDQATLARCIGVSFQQVQKYERGINRVSASRLFDIARVLTVSVDYFFRDLEKCDPAKNTFIAKGILDFSKTDDGSVDPMKHQESLELAQAFLALPSNSLRDTSLTFISIMAGNPDD